MLSKVSDFIAKQRLLSHEGLHLVALSGGADSVALLLILQQALPIRPYSEMENRRLASRPSFTIASIFDSHWADSFESFTADHLPGRNGFVAAYTSFQALCGHRLINGTLLGRDGWIFERTGGAGDRGSFGAKPSDEAKAKVYSVAELERLRMEERAKKIRAELARKNKPAAPALAEDGTPVKRPRGRPRKNPLPEQL